jgi:hypothetical protein
MLATLAAIDVNDHAHSFSGQPATTGGDEQMFGAN